MTSSRRLHQLHFDILSHPHPQIRFQYTIESEFECMSDHTYKLAHSTNIQPTPFKKKSVAVRQDKIVVCRVVPPTVISQFKNASQEVQFPSLHYFFTFISLYLIYALGSWLAESAGPIVTLTFSSPSVASQVTFDEMSGALQKLGGMNIPCVTSKVFSFILLLLRVHFHCCPISHTRT